MRFYKINFIVVIILLFGQLVIAQSNKRINWSADGNTYTILKDGNIVQVDPITETESVIISKALLTVPETNQYLLPQSYKFNNNYTRVLIFTNTAKVWRYNTRGDYWILDIISGKLRKLGKSLPEQSLMFAKFSPDGKKVAYVSGHNIYTEEINNGNITKLTNDGTRKLINGTFDWVYEEEFGCRDGFRWSPDGLKIAFWQVDATKIRDYYMLNTTDSVYSRVIPVEYPKVGESPSPVKIGVINLANRFTTWMNIEGDPQQHYIPRMDWSGKNELIVQQLDRKQQDSKLIYCNASNGSSRTFWAESSNTWIDLNSADIFGEPGGWNWVNGGKDFIWISEKDGWRHIYRISRDGKTETLLTKGNYDIGEIKCIDEVKNRIYFTASPNNATQLYLYSTAVDKGNLLQKVGYIFHKVKEVVTNTKDEPELIGTNDLKGMHDYNISPNGKLALHTFSNHNTARVSEWITLPDSKPVNATKNIAATIKTDEKINIEFLKLAIADNITLDAWINKPENFDSTKKYPVVFYVYGEPAASTVKDSYGSQNNFLYNGDIRADGYLQVAIDNRGTPMLKGAAWRKSIYRKIGNINISDMAQGFKKMLETHPYMDRERTAVWGWSGGGSSTLNLLFRYPELFKTGISIAAVTNQLNYDNIYQERYMGLPQENMEDFINGSPITYAKNLKGNLLYIHGTGDDNVHFSNAEMLVNELIKNGKQFMYMPYPNRSHSISEGPGTFQHLSTLYTNYLKEHCPPGAR
ncbi:MAG TPA: DPP IV N-terminal domain-containing protein [Ferruginibacter sp.]|nr:DPP IV N-terminal domain-containing protein [Ferruginibacter sp.]